MEEQLDLIRNINKPLNWTSFDVCNYLKREYPRKTKIGHAGTLDPLATGVLVVAVGKATKRIDSIQATVKEYVANITFGATTATYDAEIYPDNVLQTGFLNKQIVESKIKNFVGEITQLPPIYSALKINGKKAYELARAGVKVELKPRIITIYSIELLKFTQSEYITVIDIKVTCSKGTYIRSLAHDLGQELGCGGFLTGLIRTKVGEYSLENSEIFDFNLPKRLDGK